MRHTKERNRAIYFCILKDENKTTAEPTFKTVNSKNYNSRKSKLKDFWSNKG